ncbi:MAG: hypothetical protein JO191_01855 [Mycobacteriaceae bacterium]|nr:hypothetical protein [Mycobacteriaceae bacterium]
MIAVPAWVWRFGAVVRTLIVGPAVGLVLGLLALLGANSLPAGLIAMVIVTLFYIAFIARRIARFWPGAKKLSGSDRVTVVGAVRSGGEVGQSRLAPAVIEYSRALQDAAERRMWRWVIALLGVAALGIAVFDTMTATVGEAAVSWLYFAFFPVEAWWWPRRRRRLLANAQRAQELAGRLLAQQPDRSH